MALRSQGKSDAKKRSIGFVLTPTCPWKGNLGINFHLKDIEKLRARVQELRHTERSRISNAKRQYNATNGQQRDISSMEGSTYAKDYYDPFL